MIDNKNPSFTNNNLRDFLEIIKNDSRIRISNCQFEKNLSDISLSTKLRGAKEDAFYVDKDYYRINIRRGSSFFYINNHPIIARKGLQKFFYLKLTHLVEITPNIIHGETKKKNDKSKIRTIIMKPLIEAFNSKFEVK